MNRLILSLLAVLLTIAFLKSQDTNQKLNIDWDAFEEPDGKLTFLRMIPNANIWDNRRLRFDLELNSRILKELTILNAFVRLGYQNYKEQDNDARGSIVGWTDIHYTKYINQRRGFFIGFFNDSYLSKPLRSGETDYAESMTSIEIGVGRLEEISTVNQAYRILKNVKELSNYFSPNSQDDIFDLARELREIDYDFARDLRIRQIKQMDRYLSYFANRSIDLNNSYTTAQLIDGYRFSRYRPPISGYWSASRGFGALELENLISKLADDPIGAYHFGQKAIVSLENWSERNAGSSILGATSIKVDLMKSFGISNTVRTNVYGLVNYFIDSPGIHYAYRFGASFYYMPDARTDFGASLIYKSVENEMDKLDYFQLNLSASYYFSYNTVLTAWFRFYSTDAYVSRNNNVNITLNHYLY